MLRRGVLTLVILVGVAAFVATERLEDAIATPSDAPPAQGPTGDHWTNSIGMTFVRIPSGTFTMGSRASDAESHERPPHTVTISRPFYLATTEVTQSQWKAVMGSNPSRFIGDGLPVEQVSWFDAQEFIRKLNAREATTRYRLPTEAEWEYACRAGATGDEGGDRGSTAWYDPNSGGSTHPVGRQQANAWGLYDMLGNVYEWCEDWKGTYPSVEVTDPRGPSEGPGRVIRGGSWLVHSNRTRAEFRDVLPPDERRDDVGFRIVADVGAP
jgi:formylglycine-generating enzyme required for sulfatase activity